MINNHDQMNAVIISFLIDKKSNLCLLEIKTSRFADHHDRMMIDDEANIVVIMATVVLMKDMGPAQPGYSYYIYIYLCLYIFIFIYTG